MSEDLNNTNGNKKELVLDEFLIKTIVSLQTTLLVMEKDSDQKTDLLHDLADSMTAVAYNMKELKDSNDRNEKDHAKINETILNIQTCLSIIEAKLRSDNNSIEGHVKEIKYAVQEFEKLLIAMNKQDKEPLAPVKKPFNFEDAWEAIKNVRLIFIIVFLIAVAASAVIGKTEAITEILKALSSLIS